MELVVYDLEVGKGYNIGRHLAEAGRDDTFMVGFDRDGSYPKVFTALAEENME